MDKHKINNFVKHNNLPFPGFRSLSREECFDIKTKWLDILGLDASEDPIRIIERLESVSIPIIDCSVNDLDFNLERTLTNQLEILPKKVYINWHRFDAIDEMRLEDVSNYFDDIWYPSVDDICILDPSSKWALSVAHYGKVVFWSKVEI